MDQQSKEWIDNASYEELLTKWRFADIGDSLLYKETGEYFQKIMNQKRELVDHVAISKKIGWK